MQMRKLFALALTLLLPSISIAQTKEMVDSIDRKLDTIRWIRSQEAPDGGFYLAPRNPAQDVMPKPLVRATNGAVKALKLLGSEIPNKDKHAAFVLKCYDPKTGTFAEPGTKPDVASTSIGVMAAIELGIHKEKFAKAMDYLKQNAKTFEEVRIAAAAAEAWGVKEIPFKLDGWAAIGARFAFENILGKTDAEPRDIGSMTAMVLRLETPLSEQEKDSVRPLLADSQRTDGGWGMKGEKVSDIETTYRVMRALMLLKTKPKDIAALRKFLESHRNKDGGYATKPGDKSSMSGVYYATIIGKWLDELEKKQPGS
jgi:hypothetical protein